MRITFVLPEVSMSGGIKVPAIYGQFLASRGHKICFISPAQKKIPLRRKIKSLLLWKGWPQDADKRPSHLDGLDLDHRVLDHWRPIIDSDVPDGDIVIATWWETAEWVHILDQNKGAKVYFIQGHEVFPGLPIERCQATYRLPMHKIVVSQWLQAIMQAQYGDDVVDIVPNSVDRTQFFSSPRKKQLVPTIGFMYSTSPHKGLDTLLAAIGIVRQKIPNIRLICFGSQSPTPSLSLPLKSEFFLCPQQHHIRDLYSQCDVWVSTSRSEGFNLPAIEAMACRTPVVSTRTGWPEEVIRNGFNGALTQIDGVDEISSSIEQILLLNDNQWEVMSQHAYETSLIGSWEDSAQKFENALAHACQRSMRLEISGKCICLS
jgi:glycosyltransferase involved in cell wall biosynthesis